MRTQKITELGEILFENIDTSENLWGELLGKYFHKTWEEPETALRTIVDTAQNKLNRNNKRKGHCTLFMKDPILDRLILEYSTSDTINPDQGAPSSHYVTDKKRNYDSKIQKCFYSLCDRLTNEEQKNSAESGKTRGLTGWVAVTGHPLKINSERSKSRLEDIPVDNPETRGTGSHQANLSQLLFKRLLIAV